MQAGGLGAVDWLHHLAEDCVRASGMSAQQRFSQNVPVISGAGGSGLHFLTTGGLGHLVLHLFATGISSLLKDLFMSPVHFQYVVFLLLSEEILYVFNLYPHVHG